MIKKTLTALALLIFFVLNGFNLSLQKSKTFNHNSALFFKVIDQLNLKDVNTASAASFIDNHEEDASGLAQFTQISLINQYISYQSPLFFRVDFIQYTFEVSTPPPKKSSFAVFS